MKKNFLTLIIFILIIIILIIYSTDKLTIKPSPEQKNLDFVKLPEGFKIEVFAENLGGSKISTPGPNPGARMMLFNQNTVFVTIPKQGNIVALEDKNKDSKVENEKIFISNLNNPHGIDYYDGYYYIAEEDKVIRVKDENNDNIADLNTLQKLVSLPSNSGHFTRTVKTINNKMYISIGSSCNVCNEEDGVRASIQQCDLDGKNCKTFASGLRNAVDFVYYNNNIYATENGRDNLGNDIPPDEINIIKQGKNYGWPICYGNKIHDTNFDKNTYIRDPCLDTESSFIDLQAHSAPLGLAFYQGNDYPEEYKGNLFVAYHGSWNRNPPTGYKIVRINLDNKEVKDFATGFLDNNIVRGRPVGIINFRNALLVSDDNMGKIYRIYYEK